MLKLLVGLGFSPPSLAQEPSESGSDNPQASSAAFPLANFTQQAKLSPSDRQGGEYPGDYFGVTVAMTEETVFVGAMNKNAVYIYEKPADGSWANATEVGQLTTADSGVHDSFGSELAVSGDTLFVGAFANNNYQGAVYIFEKPAAGSWANATEVAKLIAPEPEGKNNFGSYIAISSDTLVIGAPSNNDKKGAAYVFTKPTDGSWANTTAIAKLTAPERQEWDYFGYGLAIDGDTIVVGMSPDGKDGAAYIFEKPASGWANVPPIAKLTASTFTSRAPDRFGRVMSMDGDTIAIGISRRDDEGHARVLIFEKPANGWVDATETVKFIAPEYLSGIFDEFGQAVLVSGDILLVGADNADESTDVPYDAIGEVYVFEKPAGGSWADATQTAKLTDGQTLDYSPFGHSFAMNGGTFVVGAPVADNSRGAAYIFE